jgi:hypothetical protein
MVGTALLRVRRGTYENLGSPQPRTRRSAVPTTYNAGRAGAHPYHAQERDPYHARERIHAAVPTDKLANKILR